MKQNTWNHFVPRAAFALGLLLGLALYALAPAAMAQEAAPRLSTGERIYVAAYSQTSPSAVNRIFYYSVTLSIHNIDPKKSITIDGADLYSIKGKLIKPCIEQPLRLDPLETVEIVLKENDKGGTSGDNFLVKWHADDPANPPLVETIMIGTAMGQGISFTSRGIPLKE